MSEQAVKVKRPISITVICVLNAIGALLSVPLLFSSEAQQIGRWYPPCLAAAVVIGLICTVGLWMMKKWAVAAYIALVIVNQAVMITMGVWSVMSLLPPAIVLFFAVKHINQMT